MDLATTACKSSELWQFRRQLCRSGCPSDDARWPCAFFAINAVLPKKYCPMSSSIDQHCHLIEQRCKLFRFNACVGAAGPRSTLQAGAADTVFRSRLYCRTTDCRLSYFCLGLVRGVISSKPPTLAHETIRPTDDRSPDSDFPNNVLLKSCVPG